jgi:hypothetical protein
MGTGRLAALGWQGRHWLRQCRRSVQNEGSRKAAMNRNKSAASQPLQGYLRCAIRCLWQPIYGLGRIGNARHAQQVVCMTV